jgi:hypothetical protein
MGQYVFYARGSCPDDLGLRERRALRSHEYVHILQFENKGPQMLEYLYYAKYRGLEGTPDNPWEAIGYLWQAWAWAYGTDPNGRWTGQTSLDWYWRPSP